jgi:hypothetical protein
MKLPCKPQYVLVKLDEDMAGPGPLEGGRWPVAKGLVRRYRSHVLTYHRFGRKPLRKGDRVAVSGGLYENCFGTVIGRDWRRNGYTYPVRRTTTKPVTLTVEVEQTVEVETA